MTKTHALHVALALLSAVGAPFARAQNPSGTPVEIGRRLTLESRVLGETRAFDVSLPTNYASSGERYPVIVVLDGEFEHEIAAAIARFYASSSMLPRTIVVGVRNTDRMRDLTPRAAPGFTVPREASVSGGADRFLDFLEKELVPYIDRTYRTTPMRVLVGHSLGGLFALHALATRPGLFIGYVVMEPATWWNNERELRAARDALQLPAAGRVRLMLVNTTHIAADTTYWGGGAPMVREFSITGETHSSMAAAGMLAALRTMFADFRPSDWRPGTRPIAMLQRYDSLSERIGYAVPIPASAYERAIRMSIHARHFEDAEQALARMERSFGESPESRGLRELMAEERATPLPASFIPLEIPARRPTAADAARFIGRWVNLDDAEAHRIEIRASGDTIIVHDRVRFPSGDVDEGDHQVIQVTPNGTLEWGLPWFRGIAALLVLKGQILDDGTMRVMREPRGWVPRGPGEEMHAIELFRRVP